VSKISSPESTIACAYDCQRRAVVISPLKVEVKRKRLLVDGYGKNYEKANGRANL
jgi:hypothetical protein